MKKLFYLVLFLVPFVSTGVFASCNVTNGTINILANEFTTLRIVMEEAQKCAGPDADFSVTHSVDHQKLQGPALAANPSEFTAKIVTNGSITPLLNKGLLRPLNDLVDKYDIQRSINFDIQGVIVVDIREGSIAEKSGMEAGDLITRIGRQKISNLKMFKDEISKYEKDTKILFLVKRGNASRFLTLRR